MPNNQTDARHLRQTSDKTLGPALWTPELPKQHGPPRPPNDVENASDVNEIYGASNATIGSANVGDASDARDVNVASGN